MPYTPDEFRAQHLDGCRLDPDHAGACLLDRPFRIRESRRWLKLTHLPESAPHEGDDGRTRGESFDSRQSAPREVDDVPLLDSTDAAAAEMRWVASEARALMAVDDPGRRARFLARKRALLAYIETTTQES